jgi:transcriptional regulator with XRE-family HTH domain
MERIGDTIGGASDLTQVELAARLHVSQNRVSRIERGDIDRAQVDTLRKYVDAVGGRLRVEVELGDERIQIAWPDSPFLYSVRFQDFRVFSSPGMRFESHLGHSVSAGQGPFLAPDG